MSSKKSKSKQKSFYELQKSIRGSWNDVDPVTKVIDRKHYSRKEKYRMDYLNNIYDCEDEEDYEDLSEFEYNFHIALHGHGKVLARDIDEAYDNAEEIIRDHLKLNNYNSDCENMNFNKEYSILYDFGKDK